MHLNVRLTCHRRGAPNFTLRAVLPAQANSCDPRCPSDPCTARDTRRVARCLWNGLYGADNANAVNYTLMTFTIPATASSLHAYLACSRTKRRSPSSAARSHLLWNHASLCTSRAPLQHVWRHARHSRIRRRRTIAAIMTVTMTVRRRI